MQMHTEPVLDGADLTQAHNDFFATINQIITDPQKQQRYRQLTPLPFYTNSLCETIYMEYPRVLQANNRYIRDIFKSEEMEQDFKQYLDDIGYDDFWSTQGMDALKKYINAFIIVDAKRELVNGRPAPYFYLLHLDKVHDVDVKQNGVCDYIIFCHDLLPGDAEAKITERRYVIDDATYRMYLFSDGAWKLDYEVPHLLPECPAFKFYSEFASKKNRINSLSPISTSLGDMDDFQFWKVSIKYYQTYGMFPIYWAYKQKCTYKDPQTGGECNGNGQVIAFNLEEGVNAKPAITPCPACASRKLIGPGSLIQVDPPQMRDEADMRDPVGYLEVDVDALKFVEDKLKALKADIIYNTTGKAAAEAQNKDAQNELQVKSSFESRTNILRTIKKNLEVAMYYTRANLARFRYRDQYVHTTVDLGSEFFLRSLEELNKDYSDARNAGRPEYELAAKREFIYLTAYHNNPDEMARLNLMQNLEPYQGYSISELRAMGIPQVDAIGFLKKLNFYTFIKRFERENVPLIQFGTALTFKQRVAAIDDTLNSYVNEQLQKNAGQGSPFQQDPEKKAQQ